MRIFKGCAGKVAESRKIRAIRECSLSLKCMHSRVARVYNVFDSCLIDCYLVKEQERLSACTWVPLWQNRRILTYDAYVTCFCLVKCNIISCQYIVFASFLQGWDSLGSYFAEFLSVFRTIYFNAGKSENIVTGHQISADGDR